MSKSSIGRTRNFARSNSEVVGGKLKLSSLSDEKTISDFRKASFKRSFGSWEDRKLFANNGHDNENSSIEEKYEKSLGGHHKRSFGRSISFKSTSGYKNDTNDSPKGGGKFNRNYQTSKGNGKESSLKGGDLETQKYLKLEKTLASSSLSNSIEKVSCELKLNVINNDEIGHPKEVKRKITPKKKHIENQMDKDIGHEAEASSESEYNWVIDNFMHYYKYSSDEVGNITKIKISLAGDILNVDQ